MFIQRAPGELYLQCGGTFHIFLQVTLQYHNLFPKGNNPFSNANLAGMRPGEFPPRYRSGKDKDKAGWLERVHPVTLETLARSPDLPSGGHIWCGGVVAHANGDLYMVNGNYVHRLTPDCKVVAERRLPLDCAYNGLLVLSDGNLVTKNLGHKPGQQCVFR